MALDEGSGGYADENLNDDEDYMEGSGFEGSGDERKLIVLLFLLIKIEKT